MASSGVNVVNQATVLEGSGSGFWPSSSACDLHQVRNVVVSSGLAVPRSSTLHDTVLTTRWLAVMENEFSFSRQPLSKKSAAINGPCLQINGPSCIRNALQDVTHVATAVISEPNTIPIITSWYYLLHPPTLEARGTAHAYIIRIFLPSHTSPSMSKRRNHSWRRKDKQNSWTRVMDLWQELAMAIFPIC